MTDSRIIAKEFNKNHRDVLQDIKKLDCSKEFRERNFPPSFYISKQHKEMPNYLITKEGCMFLVLGYRGEKAGKIREQFINAFNYYEEFYKHNNTKNLPKTYSDALRELADEVEKRELAEKQVKQLEPKAKEYDVFIGKDNQKMYAFNEVAKILTNNGFKDIGRNKLFQILREDKILMSNGKYHNLPYKEYQKYFTIKEVKITHKTKRLEYKNQPHFTPKGLDFLVKYLRKNHPDLLI